MCFYCICQLMKLKSMTMKATVVHFRVVLHVIKLFIFVKSKGSGQNIPLVNQFLLFPKKQGDSFAWIPSIYTLAVLTYLDLCLVNSVDTSNSQSPSIS